MTALEPDILCHARKALSGKRIALVGFSASLNLEFSNRIADADGFTRAISPAQTAPSSDVLKPFELILVNVAAAAGTDWMDPQKLASVAERCIAVGELSHLFELAAEPAHAFREYGTCSHSPDELLLRCVLALRARSPISARAVPAGTTVVLADDDSSVTSIVRRALERNGLRCEVAANGQQALETITRLKPCAAILDVHMPTIDGFEVLSRMKGIAELAQTRVILLTGSEQEADVIRGFTLGADDYICKPFNPMELTIRLMRAIGRI